MTDCYLLVPTSGLLEMLVGTPVDVEAALIARSGEGRLVSIEVSDGTTSTCRVTWFHSPIAMVNPRARQALVHLSDLHMIFTGPVMFHDVEEERLGVIVQLLSMREEE